MMPSRPFYILTIISFIIAICLYLGYYFYKLNLVSNLCAAAYRDDIVAVKVLIAQGAEVNGVDMHAMSPLMSAAQGGHVDVAKYLLEKGAVINAVRGDGTALTCASGGGHIAMIHMLLAHGADPCWQNSEGGNALTIAKGSNHPDVAKLLAHTNCL